MFHYHNSIQNTRGDALIGYFVKAVDITSGDVVDIYADESSTPIVSVSGEANAAEVDSDGNVSFYVESGTYHLDIYATDGSTLVKTIENIPMITAGDFLTDGQLADEGGAAMVGTSDGGTVQEALDRIGTFVGYDTGSGGTTTQTTSKTTTVNLNALCGQIVTHDQAMPSGSQVAFTLLNDRIAPTDVVVACLVSAGGRNLMDYTVRAGQPSTGVQGGNCAIGIRNDTGSTLSDAITINFVVIKGVTS